MPRRITPKVPLTPEQLQEQESRQALAEESIKERAFLCYLLTRPAEMQRFVGNVAMNLFFVEPQHRWIYECMEKVYLEHGSVDDDEFLRLVAEELIERGVYDQLGGKKYLIDLACHVNFAPQFVWEFPTREQYEAWIAEHRAIAAELATSNETEWKKRKEGR